MSVRGATYLWLATLAACAGGASNSYDPDTVCSVTVTPRSATAPARLVATGSVTDRKIARWKRTWSVSLDGAPVPFTPGDTESTSVEVDAAAAGSYRFELNFDALGAFGYCRTHEVATVTPAGGKTALYRLRVTPPVASGLPRQDKLVQLHAGTNLDEQEVTLAAGAAVAGTLVGPKGGVPGTVRFLDEGAPGEAAPRLDVVAAAAADGAFATTLVLDRRYRPLLVPSDLLLAPRVGNAELGANLAGARFAVDAGGAVGGTLRDEAGKPVAGARVALRAPPLASGVGVTSAQGGFALRAMPGTYSVTVQAQAASWSLAGPVTVNDATTIDIAWQGARTPLSGKVLGTGGAPVPGARVTLRAETVGKVARVTVAGASADVDAAVDLAVTTGPDGSLPAIPIPTGAWQAIVEPPAGGSDGITAFQVKASPGESWKLQLRPRTKLAGLVRDEEGAPVAGVRVLAVERGGPAVSLETRTDARGAWTLQADPGLAVLLTFEPPTGRALVAAHLEWKEGAALDVALVKGIRYGGVVRPPSGSPLAGARIEAWCTTACGSAPVAVAATDGEGAFTLHLPDPGR